MGRLRGPGTTFLTAGALLAGLNCISQNLLFKKFVCRARILDTRILKRVGKERNFATKHATNFATKNPKEKGKEGEGKERREKGRENAEFVVVFKGFLFLTHRLISVGSNRAVLLKITGVTCLPRERCISQKKKWLDSFWGKSLTPY